MNQEQEHSEFATYLLNRGINFPKPLITVADICDDADKLARIGQMVNEYREELSLIIEARLAPIREELLMKATPYEVYGLREVIMEIASFHDDFDKFSNARNNQIKIEEEKKTEQEKTDADNGTMAFEDNIISEDNSPPNDKELGSM